MRATLPAILAAGMLVAGCQQEPAPTIRTGEGMVDPVSGVLDPRYVDGTFSLSVLIEERLKRPLNNSDRREIDAAADAAMSGAPAAPAARWQNDLRGHRGSVDLVSWRLDQRAGELCGVIEHESRLEDALAGAITICRASIDPAWRIDEVVWDRAVATRSTAPTRQPSRQPARAPAPQTPPADPGRRAQVPPVNYGPGSAIPPANNPQPGVGAPPPPVTGGGAATLGDALASPSAN